MTKTIAIDFDGTLVENAYPKIGKRNPAAFDYVIQQKQKGATLILWTCRTGILLDAAIAYCKQHGLLFDYVNENTRESMKRFGTDPRKVYADVYMDDKSVLSPSKEVRKSMKEIRICEIRAEAPAGAAGLVLTGRPLVYDTPTVINDPAGPYTEIIRRGALDDTDISDARLMYNHDLNKVPLARTPKTMQLSKGPAGLDMAAQLPDTEEARAVHTAVERGDLTGMSFAFVVPPGGDKWDIRTKTREIFKIKKILEVSVVPFPAYPQASVEARAAMQALDSDERKQAIIAANKILIKEIG